MRKTYLFAGLFAVTAALAVGGNANAATVSWATWSNTYTGGNPGGSASATIPSTPGITVTYSGEVQSVENSYPFWVPTGSYADGTIVANAPPQSGGSVQLFGGIPTTIDTITFSSAVVDPVMSIWSLGQPEESAEFDFGTSEPFNIVAGGPNTPYGGGSITLTGSGDGVSGQEGNGTIQFTGTYTSLTFTTPLYENWYGFTVGIDSVAVPAPASALSGSILLAGVALANKLRRRRQA